MSQTEACILKFPSPPKRRTKPPGKVLPIPLRWPDALHLLAVCRHEQAVARGSRKRAAERDEITLHLGLYLGLRVSEMCEITCEDFDFVERQARINQGKGGKDRVVPIAKAAMPVLRDWAVGRTGLFLPTGRKKQFNPRSLHARMQRLGRAAGLPWLHPHSLRHGCAGRLLSIGMDVRRIQKFLGHADLRTTMIYLDVMPIDLRDDADRM